MLKTILKADTPSGDVAIIETSFGYYCRYGLQVSPRFDTFAGAFGEFERCIRHAVAAEMEAAA
jgi:hypothetical protein